MEVGSCRRPRFARLRAAFHPGLSQVLQMAVLADTTDQRVDGQKLATRFGLPLTTLQDLARRLSA